MEDEKMELLANEEFSKLSLDDAKEHLLEVLNELPDEEIKKVYEYLTESPELKEYLNDLD